MYDYVCLELNNVLDFYQVVCI